MMFICMFKFFEFTYKLKTSRGLKSDILKKLVQNYNIQMKTQFLLTAKSKFGSTKRRSAFNYCAQNHPTNTIKLNYNFLNMLYSLNDNLKRNYLFFFIFDISSTLLDFNNFTRIKNASSCA